MGLALAVPTVPGTVLGFAAAGFGVATLVPAAMHEADELPGLKPGSGLTLVSWLMRLGFLLSPPVVGLVATRRACGWACWWCRSRGSSCCCAQGCSGPGATEPYHRATRPPWECTFVRFRG